MDLSEIREKFRDLTGRYDLVTSNGTDQGADFFINAGQRWLDRQLDYREASAESSLSLSTGAASAEVDGVRGIKKMLVGSSTTDFAFLKKSDYDPIKRLLKNQENSDRGTPRYYAPSGRGIQGPPGREAESQKVLLWPPTDGNYTLIVQGLYVSEPLESDSDETFWSVNFPDILIKAAAFKSESFQRNTSGESDYRRSLLDDLRALDHDQVEQAIVDEDQMRDSWSDIDL